MSTKKIIFFVTVGIITLIGLFALWKISQNQQNPQSEHVTSLTIWAVWGTTEQYRELFDWFRSANKKYKNTNIDIQVFPDYEKYRSLLLSTLSSETGGPDIFVVDAGADDILESKIQPVPSSLLPAGDFDKRYEDIFLPLMSTEGEWKTLTTTVLWIPIGYETLGVFYNKDLVTSPPTTWSEVELLSARPLMAGTFATNLWLSPLYTPFATDIISLFLAQDGIIDVEHIQSGGAGALDRYLSYARTLPDSSIPSDSTSTETDMQNISLLSQKSALEAAHETTLDLFIQGKIALVIGYPSLIRNIEKAKKRSWQKATESLILTEKIPQTSHADLSVNIAQYYYFAISKKSSQPTVWADFLAYLMQDTTLAQAKSLFPTLISPIRSFSVSQGSFVLSPLFQRTRMESFLPSPWQKLIVHHYRLKEEYNKGFENKLDRDSEISSSDLLKEISERVACTVDTTVQGKISEKCQ